MDSRIRIIVFILFLSLTGCSVLSTLPDEAIQTPVSATADTPVATEVENIRTQIPPIDVTIAQEFVREGYLFVKARIVPKLELPAQDVVLQLTGLSEGEVVEVQTKKLSDIVHSAKLESNDPILVDFKMPNLALSEYQIRCAWGPEARSLVAKVMPEDTADHHAEKTSSHTKKEEPQIKETEPKLEDFTYYSTEIECPTKPCDVIYTISASILNNTGKKLIDFKIALGLAWTDEGAQVVKKSNFEPINQDEQVVDLGNVNINSGSSKKLNLTFDKPVAIIPGGSFIPTLRILSYRLE